MVAVEVFPQVIMNAMKPVSPINIIGRLLFFLKASGRMGHTRPSLRSTVPEGG